MRDDFEKKRGLLRPTGGGGFWGTLLSPGLLAVAVYRFGKWVDRQPMPLRVPGSLVYFVLFYMIQSSTGISVQKITKIGQRFVILNHTGVFVVAERIGDDFTVCEGVTVGNVRGSTRLPIIGDDVYLEPGCKVLGELSIGNHVIVRGNSLVLQDVPDNSIVTGNPARIRPMKEPPKTPPREKERDAGA
jgi:serine O-acetyltransferase